MPGHVRRITLERAIQLALAATILTALLSGGSLLDVIEPARLGRWVALLVLVALALSYGMRSRELPSEPVFHAGAALAALAFTSALWSATPALTVARAGAFTLVLVAAAALAHGARGRAGSTEAILAGVLAGAVAVAVGGLLVLVFAYDRAVQPATTVSPARYQGLGGGPNMAPMVLALAVPLAFHFAVVARSRVRRGAALGVLVLLVGSIAFSGSRGAFAAAATGLLVYALTAARGRARVRLVVIAALIVAAIVALSQVPDTAATNAPEPTGQDPNPVLVTPASGYLDANVQGPRLQDDVGHPGIGVADTRRRVRSLLGTSGRTEAWVGTLGLIAERPFVGYGFGTEDRTFVDRYVFFNSNLPENSYLGMLLQLGVVGLALLIALSALLLWPTARRPVAAAAAGAFAAALVLAVFQSYLYAAGNAATTAAWVSAFAIVAVGKRT